MRSGYLGPRAPDAARIGYGAMQLSLESRPDEATAIGVIHAALDHGITLIDTADVYCIDDGDIGHSERLIAKALQLWSGGRDGIVVATKGGLTRPGGRWERNGKPAHLKQACERSLRALGADTIDLYQFHSPDPRVPFEDSIGALQDLQDAGKIRSVGLSNVSVDHIRRAEQMVTVATVQNMFSVFFRDPLEDGVLEYCTSRGIGFLAYSPVGGRDLCQHIGTNATLRRIAAAHGASPWQVALAWLLAKSPALFAIPSARTVEHIADSATAGDLTLTIAEVQAIDSEPFTITR